MSAFSLVLTGRADVLLDFSLFSANSTLTRSLYKRSEEGTLTARLDTCLEHYKFKVHKFKSAITNQIPFEVSHLGQCQSPCSVFEQSQDLVRTELVFFWQCPNYFACKASTK